MRKIVVFLFVLLASFQTPFAQTACPAYWNDIVAFKQRDTAHPPAQGAILFVGSSSFTKWTDVQDYFPGYTIINRGFGGSTLLDVIRYAYEVIIPYHPKQVVIYCGENDFASSDSVQVRDVVTRFKTLFRIIRENLPDAQVHYISMKPSPSRAALLQKFQQANAAIKGFLKDQKNAGYIDVYAAMLDANGTPKASIFLSDSLHMNASGYAIWKIRIQPYLIKQ